VLQAIARIAVNNSGAALTGDLLETLKMNIDVAGQKYEDLILGSVRPVDDLIVRSIEKRTLAMEEIWRQIVHQDKTRGYRHYWNESTWQQTW
jgi:hypothetical protein